MVWAHFRLQLCVVVVVDVVVVAAYRRHSFHLPLLPSLAHSTESSSVAGNLKEGKRKARNNREAPNNTPYRSEVDVDEFKKPVN